MKIIHILLKIGEGMARELAGTLIREAASIVSTSVRGQNTMAPTRRTGRNRNLQRRSRQAQAAVPPPSFDHLIDASAAEQDFRLAILNALLRTPHREVGPYIPLFRHVYERDPLFFAQLGAWYFENGSVHDLKQLFIAFLVTSRFSSQHREVGLELMSRLPPYQVQRVVALVKGHQHGDTFVEGIAPVPRSLRTAVAHYLKEREANRQSFDSVVLHARKPLKSLYASLRIKPGEYAQKVLFDNDPPEGSRLYVLKQLTACSEPAQQARLIVENKIPFRVAISSLKQVTPSVLAALVDAMSPQEVINNLASLKKRGAMDNDDLRALIEDKLEKARSDSRVSALKTRQALQAADVDPDMAAKVAAVGDERIKSGAKIKRATALFIDKSGSMELAIQVGKQIAAIIAPNCESDLYVLAFDNMAYEIKSEGSDLSDWEKAFKGITAAGYTSCGVALEMLRRQNRSIEQILIVTDQEENTKPFLADAMKSYQESTGILPDVLIVNVGRHGTRLQTSLLNSNINFDSYTFTGDYYSLPSLIPMLAGGTRLDLLMEIMSHPLPARKIRQLAGAKS